MAETQNKFGLSKKTNVAVAGITGLTVICNGSVISSAIGAAAILIIALYHLYNQSKIDMMVKESN